MISAVENEYRLGLSAENDRHISAVDAISSEYETEYDAQLSAVQKTLNDELSAAEATRRQKDQILIDQETELYNRLLEEWRREHGGEDPPVPWNPEAQEHFRPYTEKVAEDEQAFSDNYGEQITSECAAHTKYSEAMAGLKPLKTDKRQLWQIDLGGYSSLGRLFKADDETYGNAPVTVYSNELLAVYAKHRYEFHTGHTYPDYENQDQPAR